MRPKTPRSLIPKLNFESLQTNINNNYENEQNNDLLYNIAFKLENLVIDFDKKNDIGKIISQLKNIVLNIYKTINENNRNINKIKINSKEKELSLKDTEEISQHQKDELAKRLSDASSSSNDSKYKSETYKNGTYEGEFKNGLREGKGTMNYKNGFIYEGDWKNDRREGRGLLYKENDKLKKERYEGEFKDGKIEGKGISYYSNGDKYEGEYKKWNKEG